MRQPLLPMIIPALAAHVSGAQFIYPDHTLKELCGMMANLVADSGAGKGQLSGLVEAMCGDFRVHDDGELEKLVEWQKMVKSKSANKEKPVRPDISFWYPPADMTNAAFVQNAMGCEKLGARTMFINMPEVEMADRMCGGHKQISQTLRNIYDCQRSGALRAHPQARPADGEAPRLAEARTATLQRGHGGTDHRALEEARLREFRLLL